MHGSSERGGVTLHGRSFVHPSTQIGQIEQVNERRIQDGQDGQEVTGLARGRPNGMPAYVFSDYMS